MVHNRVQVELLDGSYKEFPAAAKTSGESFLKLVTSELNLIESDYFGVSFRDSEDNVCWIDPMKTFKEQQLKLDNRQQLRFGVKFFPPDPGEQLHDEFTRYLFVLAIKRDIRQANISCAESMLAILTSCLVQSEFGDFDADECASVDYIAKLNLLPNPSTDILNRIRDLHRQRVGQKPFESDFALLEKIRSLETYGTKPVSCRGSDGSACRISVSADGILVFHDSSLLKTWHWAQIRKLSFKHKLFLIKLRRDDGSPSEVKTFTFRTRNAAKTFWKFALENHSFFKLRNLPAPKSKPLIISKGSNFRYSGKTQEELKIALSRTPTRQPSYHRLTSLRKKKVPAESSVRPDELHSHPSVAPPPYSAHDAKPDVKPEVVPDIKSEVEELVKNANEIHKERNDSDLKSQTVDDEPVYDEPRKLRCDYNYSICREILNTERTHLKDLQVVIFHFRSALREETQGTPEQILSMLYSTLDPIFEFHKEFLSQLEHRVAEWEAESQRGGTIGELFNTQMKRFAQFEPYFERLEGIMHEIDSSLQLYPRFLQVWRSFESRKLCYLPISTFLIKPICRLFQYYAAIGRMERREGNNALNELAGPVNRLRPTLKRCLQFQIMSQLQRELIGADRLVRSGREFIREGYLRKWAGPRGGFNARMFFLFNDCVLWTTSKIEQPTVGALHSKPWKVSVELPINNLSVELSDMERSAPHSFALNLPDPKTNGSDDKVTSMILSASSADQRNKWINDVELAANRMRHSKEPFYSTATGQPTHTMHVTNVSVADDERSYDDSKMKQNTTTQVCWFRYCTLGFEDHLNMSQNVMAGYLMRKFKNKPSDPPNNLEQQTRNWQKLWVVLNTFSIHFYKRHQESAPLANLPLLEYQVFPVDPSSIPNCKHQYVFMIKLKKHEYHFAAETEYSYQRWMHTLKIATLSNDVS